MEMQGNTVSSTADGVSLLHPRKNKNHPNPLVWHDGFTITWGFLGRVVSYQCIVGLLQSAASRVALWGRGLWPIQTSNSPIAISNPQVAVRGGSALHH